MDERRLRASPAALAADALLLACALVGCTGFFLTLYGSASAARYGSPLATSLDRCAAQLGPFLLLAALLALAWAVAWWLPKFRWAAVGVLAAATAAGAALNWTPIVQGAGLAVHEITVLFASRVSWGQVFPYDPGLTRAGAFSAVRLFLALALALLAPALGWAVIRARRWWLVLLLTLPPLLPGLLADLYPDWLFLMVLAACWCAMLLSDLCKWAAPSSRSRLTLAALGCSALLLGAVTLLFPREGYARPQWALKAEAGLHDALSRGADFFSRWEGPFGSAATYVGAAGEADLTRAGPLSYTGRTALRVEADCEGRLYLRGTSLAVYEDGVWTALPEGVYQDYLDGLEEDPPFPLALPALLGTAGARHTVTVENLGAAGACAYAPYFLTVQDWQAAGTLPVEDAYLARRQGQTRFTLTFAEVDPPEQTGPTVRYQNLAYANYLDVPEELEAALAPLVSQVGGYWSGAGAANALRHPHARLEAAQLLAQLLAQRCQYDPQAPAAPDGTDPVAYFLTESHRGYCMHYASAATLMLRSLGIPARYVSGFTAQCRPDLAVDVPDRAAHAWVEIWLDGFGWYPVEVTPAAAFDWYEQGDAQPSLPPSEEPEESRPLQPTPQPTPSPLPSAPPAPGEEDGPADASGGAALPKAPLAAAAALLGAAALLWLGRRLMLKRRARALDGPDSNRAALYAYGCLLRLERWGGSVDPRAVELAQKARFSQHVLSREELDELRRLLDRERRALCARLGPARRLAFRYLWGSPRGETPRENGENPDKTPPAP